MADLFDDLLKGAQDWAVFIRDYTIPDMPAALAQYAERLGRPVEELTEAEQKQAVMSWVLAHGNDERAGV